MSEEPLHPAPASAKLDTTEETSVKVVFTNLKSGINYLTSNPALPRVLAR